MTSFWQVGNASPWTSYDATSVGKGLTVAMIGCLVVCVFCLFWGVFFLFLFLSFGVFCGFNLNGLSRMCIQQCLILEKKNNNISMASLLMEPWDNGLYFVDDNVTVPDGQCAITSYLG